MSGVWVLIREEGVLIEGVDRSSEYGKKGNTNIQGANASIALVFVSSSLFKN